MRKCIALMLAALLLTAPLAVPVTAAEGASSKEEVVYVNLNADGSVDEINVVNIFNLEESGTVIDHGDYTSLRNMTSTEAIQYENGTVTVQASAGKLYYEGKLNSVVMPWKVSIRYFLDGKEYSAQEIAGKNGALRIALDITRNKKSNTNFYDAFALQVTLTLDTAKCRNIIAQEATVANVGSSKQLTHTILPGKGASLEITADVVDFSMDGISINAIPLNLNVEVDNGALLEQVDELIGAIEKLDDGAKTLKDGVAELKNNADSKLPKGVGSLGDGTRKLETGAAELQKGTASLQTGAKELEAGAAAVDGGIQTLNAGIKQIQTALNTLNKESSTLTTGSATFQSALNQLQAALGNVAVTSADLSELTNASSRILDGIIQVADGAEALRQNVSFAALKEIMFQNGLSVDSLKQNNSIAMSELRKNIDENKALAAALGLGSLFDSLEKIILLLDANNAFINGTGTYLNALNANISTLADGAAELETNYALFDSEITKLANALENLPGVISQLTSAVNTLCAEYGKLHNGISGYTGAVAEIVSGYTQVVNGSAQLASSSGDLKSGAAALYAGTGDLLSGATELYKGADTLNAGVTEMDSGVNELLGGISRLFDGAKQLADGTAAMREESAGIDGMISDKVDNMLSSITGENVETGSFVSNKNTQVESVQFVIRAAGVQPDAVTQDVIDVEAPLTFWQKLLKLFGL